MPYYVWSGATGLNDGSSWANAWTSIASATGVAAGSDVYVSDDHYQSSTANLTLEFAATVGNPVRIVSVNRASGLASAGAAVEVRDGALTLTIRGSVYMHGLHLRAVTTGIPVNARIALAESNNTDVQAYEKCELQVAGGGSSSKLTIGTVNNIAPCAVAFIATDVFVELPVAVISCAMTIDGGALLSGALPSGTNGVFSLASAGEGISLRVRGFDMSAMPASAPLIQNEIKQSGEIRFDDCKLPSSWTGVVVDTPSLAATVHMTNCGSTTANYQRSKTPYMGTLREDSAIYRNGGASDGTTPVSRKLATNASSGEYVMAMRGDPIAIWNEVVGSPVTVTVHVVHDGAANLTDAELWLAAYFLGDSSSPLATRVTSRRATPLTTPADQPASTETWTGTSGFSNENKQKITLTFTPQRKGLIHLTVLLAKPSTTVYYCPEPVVS